MFESISKSSGALLLAGTAALVTSCGPSNEAQLDLSVALPPVEGLSQKNNEFISVWTRWGGAVEFEIKQAHHSHQIKLHPSDDLVLRATYTVTDRDFRMMAAGVGYIPTLVYKDTERPYLANIDTSSEPRASKAYSAPIYPPGDVFEIEAWLPLDLADEKLTLALLFDNVRDRTYKPEDNEHLIPLETKVIRK